MLTPVPMTFVADDDDAEQIRAGLRRMADAHRADAGRLRLLLRQVETGNLPVAGDQAAHDRGLLDKIAAALSKAARCEVMIGLLDKTDATVHIRY